MYIISKNRFNITCIEARKGVKGIDHGFGMGSCPSGSNEHEMEASAILPYACESCHG